MRAVSAMETEAPNCTPESARRGTPSAKSGVWKVWSDVWLSSFELAPQQPRTVHAPGREDAVLEDRPFILARALSTN